MNDVTRLVGDLKRAKEEASKFRGEMLNSVSTAASDVRLQNMGLNVNPTGSGVKAVFSPPPGVKATGYQAFGARAERRLAEAAKDAVVRTVERGL